MDFSPPFGAWIKARRRQLDLTQAELAERANFSLAAIRKIEEGSRISSRALAEALLGSLEIPEEARDAFISFARGSDAHPPLSHLPTPLTTLVGRASEVAEIEHAFAQPDSRLITLVGPPGVGKTRLAVQIAHDLQASFADGAVFVPLAAVSVPEIIPAALATAFATRALGPGASLGAITRFIDARQILLVLDNFEQIVDGASLINTLLASCPGLSVLVTSRVILNLFGERVIEILPLADGPALELFVRHATAAKPGFVITSDTAPIVAEICRRLDHLPLAIELAAARARMLTPRKLLERLSDHSGAQLELLTNGPRDWPERQRTLRATIDWSYALLTPDEQRFFRRMGVFSGGCVFEMARSVCADSADDAVTEALLQSLLDKSLIHASAGYDGTARFDLLETLREYALARLDESGEGTAIRRRMTIYLNKLGDDAEPYVIRTDRIDWLRRLATERDNVRSALAWSRGPDGDYALGLRLAGQMGWAVAYGARWQANLPLLEVQLWLENIENRILDLPENIRAMTLYGLSDMIQVLGDSDNERRLLTLVEEQARLSGDASAQWLVTRTRVVKDAFVNPDFPSAVQSYERLILQAGDDPLRRAFALTWFGQSLAANGQPDRGVALLDEALRLWEQHGVVWAEMGGVSAALRFLTGAHAWHGNTARAVEFATRTIATDSQIGWEVGLQYASLLGAFPALNEGHLSSFYAFARTYYQHTPALYALGHPNPLFRAVIRDQARCLLHSAPIALARRGSSVPAEAWPIIFDLLADALRNTGQIEASTRLYGVAWAHQAQTFADEPLRSLFAARIDAVRKGLASDPGRAADWEAGTRMSITQARAYSLTLAPPR